MMGTSRSMFSPRPHVKSVVRLTLLALAISLLQTPQMLQASRTYQSYLTVANRTKATVKIVIGGHGVQPASFSIGAGRSHSVRLTTPTSYLVTANAPGAKARSIRVNRRSASLSVVYDRKAPQIKFQ